MTLTRTLPMALGLVALVATLLLAVPATGSSLGAGCDEERPAVAHKAGGEIVEADRDRVPCGTDTGHYTGETTIAVTQEGTVWFSAADWEWALVKSEDEGATWERYAVPGPQAYPGCHAHTAGVSPLRCDNSETAKNNTVADAFLHVDPVTDRMMWAKTYGYATCSSMNMTADDGDTWQAVSSFACPGGDYEKIASGPAPDGTPQPTGEDTPHVYYTCTNGSAPTFVVGPARVCYKSLDAGLTWQDTGVPVTPTADGCLHFQEPPKVAQDDAAFEGRIYQPLGCAGLNPANVDGAVQVAWSDDQATTWTYSSIPTGEAGSTGGGLFGGVTLAVDEAGTVYVLYIDGNGQLAYVYSEDGAASWSAPIVVNAPGVIRTGPAAQIAAAGDGQIAIAYYGRPADEDDASIQHGYITESFDASGEAPTFYSSQLNATDDPLYFTIDGEQGSLPRNDYLGVTIAPDGTPWTALVKLTDEVSDEGFRQSTGFAARTVWGETR